MLHSKESKKKNKKQNRRSEREEEEERTSTRTNRTFPNNVWPPRAATTEFALNPDTNTNTSTTPDQARPIPLWLWPRGLESPGRTVAVVRGGGREVSRELLSSQADGACWKSFFFLCASHHKVPISIWSQKSFLFLSQRDVTCACCLFLARKLARISSWKSSSNLSQFGWGLTCDYPVNYWCTGSDNVNYDIICSGNI